MKKEVRLDWMLNVSDAQIYRAKRKANEIIDGNHVEQYLRLWGYCEMIRRHNPGCTALLKVERPWLESAPLFERMFIIFDAQVRGFTAHYRPFIGLDACFLEGPYGG